MKQNCIQFMIILGMKRDSQRSNAQLVNKSNSRQRNAARRPFELCIGNKHLTRHLIHLIAQKPEKVKYITLQLISIFQRYQPQRQFTQNTIQKRVYDILLVLNGAGLLINYRKSVMMIPEARTVMNREQIKRQIHEAEEALRMKIQLKEDLKKFRKNMLSLIRKNKRRQKQIQKKSLSSQVEESGKKFYIDQIMAISVQSSSLKDAICSSPSSVTISGQYRIYPMSGRNLLTILCKEYPKTVKQSVEKCDIYEED